jgi:16S rRNA processing protein RimM
VTDSSDPVVVGRLTQPYGLKGWIKVHSYTESMENLLALCLQKPEGCQIFRAEQWQPVTVEAGKRHGKGLILKLKGVETPEQARLYSGCDLAVPVSALPPLADDEIYWYQLEGLRVVVDDPQRGELVLGRVDHLFETGANDVVVVKPCEGSIDDRERLLPYLPRRVVLDINLAAGTMKVDWDPDF